MQAHEPTILAMGGGGFSMEPDNPRLDDYALALTGVACPRVCFVPTASGDAEGYVQRFHAAFAGRAQTSVLSLFARDGSALDQTLCEADLVYIGGGNSLNMLAVWRAHGVDRALEAAWRAGVVIAGLSAGMVCWFEAALTDSFGPALAPMTGLGWLSGSACPHYDGEPARRARFRALIDGGELPAGLAADDGCALHFVGTELAAAVSSRPGAAAYRVEPGRETRIAARLLE